jgi:hypothetical protein
MDIFAGMIAALWVASIIEHLSKPIDKFVQAREQTAC